MPATGADGACAMYLLVCRSVSAEGEVILDILRLCYNLSYTKMIRAQLSHLWHFKEVSQPIV
jgi:hypothetical protein